jgi:serine/threonine-protein kinase
MTAPKTLEKIGRYQVLERVGKGGMGVLYRGFDPVLDREVAIKLMHADFSEDTEQMRPRFYREARAAAKLNHRNIVTIFEFAEESNIPYIVMEFLRGTSLGARIATTPALTLDDKLNVVAQLCDGLSYAHEQGVVHRDVKPDNVFILEDGSVKLLDFGIAKLTSSTLTRQGDVLGSASYMSPEQVGGSELVDGRADIFSTGVVLYELLSGRKPFEGDSPTVVIVKILKEEPTPIETHTPNLPPDVIALVKRTLQKNPDDRFPSAEALSRELQSIRKSLHPSASNARMDETRFASTQVMKALHEDFQKSRGVSTPGTGGRSTVEDAALAAPPPSKGWMIPVSLGAVLLLAVGGFFYSRSATPTPAPITTTARTTPPVKPASTSSTPVAAATTAATNIEAPPPVSPTTPAKGAASAAATKPGAPAAKPVPPPPPAATVSVSLTGGYPFEVFDGAKSVSAAATSHELKEPAGKALRVQAAPYFLSQTVRVEGSSNQPFEYAAPGLGSLDVRSAQETCDVVIGTRKLGNPPLVVKEIAAGSYKVDIVCGSDVVKSHYATVRAGETYVAAIR